LRSAARRAKRETRVAIAREVPGLVAFLVFVLRGVKGLEKVLLVDGESLGEVLGRYSAVLVDPSGPPPEGFEGVWGTVVKYWGVLERLSAEVESLLRAPAG
jgi:hypothetical protein